MSKKFDTGRQYHIAFDTNEMSGKIVATSVTMGREIVTDINKKFRIDLCDDPLYPDLVRYVKGNPLREV